MLSRNVRTVVLLPIAVLLFYILPAADFETVEADDSEEDPFLKPRRPSCFICSWVPNHDRCGDLNFTVMPDERVHYMTDCAICYKKVRYNNEGEKISILRGCALDSPIFALGCQYIYYQDSYVETCACDSHYCNSSHTFDGIWRLPLLAVILIVCVRSLRIL